MMTLPEPNTNFTFTIPDFLHPLDAAINGRELIYLQSYTHHHSVTSITSSITNFYYSIINFVIILFSIPSN